MQRSVHRLDHYVRGRTWIATTIGAEEVAQRNDSGSNFTFTRKEIDAWLADPVLYLSYRKRLEADFQAGHIITQRGSAAQTEARAFFTSLMKKALARKPEIAEHLLPDFPPFCKRLTPGPGYLEALSEDNVHVIPTGIERITSTGIQTTDGVHREVDAIVCATGFDTSYKSRFPIYGLHGHSLRERWDHRVESYLSMTIDGFPNLFMLYGPNAGLGTGNLLILFEYVSAYIAQVLSKMQTENILTVQPSPRAVKNFTDFCDEYFAGTVYSEECSSWYKGGTGKNGRVVALWPGSSLHAIQALKRPRSEDFEYEYVDGNEFGWIGDGWSKGDRVEGADTTYYLNNLQMLHEPLAERRGLNDIKVDLKRGLGDGTGQNGGAEEWATGLLALA